MFALRSSGSKTLRSSLVFQLLARSLLITTENTPNPSTVKFRAAGKNILEDSEGHDFRTLSSARRAPLARNLLLIDGVSGVFIGKDFVAITKKSEGKDSDATWAQLKPQVYSVLMDHFNDANAVAVYLDKQSKQMNEPSNIEPSEDSELVLMIKELLEEKVRPMAQDDGGDVIFKGFDESSGVVSVQLLGSCVGCPSSTITLKNGVENMLRHYIPEVKQVDAVVGEVEEDDQTHHLTFKEESK